MTKEGVLGKKKFISFGGLGDAFIVALKIKQWRKQNNQDVLWEHTESNDIDKPLGEISKLLNQDCVFFHRPNYTQKKDEYIKMAEKENSEIVPVPVSGECSFWGSGMKLENGFLDDKEHTKEHVTIQVSGGQNNTRQWNLGKNIDICKIAEFISGTYKKRVILIGNDERYKSIKCSSELIQNKVGLTTLTDALGLIGSSTLFIGLSGLLNYYACASRVQNIHLVEGPKQEKDYYSSDWQKYTCGIKGGPNQLVRAIKSYEAEGVL